MHHLRSEKVEGLIRKYLEGTLSGSEKETLLFLLHDVESEEAVHAELSHVWSEVSETNREVSSKDVFGKISENLNITDAKITEDGLRLKEVKSKALRSPGRKIYALVKYAAVFIIASLLAGIAYYAVSVAGKRQEIAQHEISVPYGSRIRIVLADSSVVWLNSGSKLIYPDRFTETSREVLMEGEAFFDIRENAQTPFYVKTSDLVVKVLGTRFNIKAYPEEDVIKTTLVSGHIQIEKIKKRGRRSEQLNLESQQKAVYIKESKRLLLDNGRSSSEEILTLQRARRPGHVNDMNEALRMQDIQIETSWKDDLLIFRDEPLFSLAKKLERWYGVEIEIVDDEAGKYRFTGSIENESVEEALNALKIASSLSFEIEGDSKITISTNR